MKWLRLYGKIVFNKPMREEEYFDLIFDLTEYIAKEFFELKDPELTMKLVDAILNENKYDFLISEFKDFVEKKTHRELSFDDFLKLAPKYFKEFIDEALLYGWITEDQIEMLDPQVIYAYHIAQIVERDLFDAIKNLYLSLEDIEEGYDPRWLEIIIDNVVSRIHTKLLTLTILRTILNNLKMGKYKSYEEFLSSIA